MFRIVLLASLVVAISVEPSLAWQANTEGPDVFGVTKVLAAEGNDRESLVVQCDSKDVLFVAYIMRKKEFDAVTEGPATLYLQGNSSAPLKLDASIRAWNDNYAGIVAVGRVPEVMAAIQEIKNTKGKVNVGYDIAGNRDSASFSSRGSKAAMQRVIDNCKLSDIALPPT
ncbi:hypothetical protein ACWGS9_28180 [Bradyrhizobium sp. Arg314]